MFKISKVFGIIIIKYLDMKGSVSSLDNIRLSIKSTQYLDDNKTGPIEFITEGIKYEKDNKVLIEYDEAEAMGYAGVKTLMEIEDSKVTLTRSGKVKSNMVFERGRIFEGNYVTPYNVMTLNIFATLVDVNTIGNPGHIDLEYEMNLGDVHTFNVLNLTYEKKEGGLKRLC